MISKKEVIARLNDAGQRSEDGAVARGPTTPAPTITWWAAAAVRAAWATRRADSPPAWAAGRPVAWLSRPEPRRLVTSTIEPPRDRRGVSRMPPRIRPSPRHDGRRSCRGIRAEIVPRAVSASRSYEDPDGGFSKSARDRFRTRNVSAPCDVCGAWPEVVHIPMHGRGFRCSEHCENCGPAANSREREHQAGANA